MPASSDPSACRVFCSQFIPTEANGFQGADVSRLSSKAVDDAWQKVATELDEAKRAANSLGRAFYNLADWYCRACR